MIIDIKIIIIKGKFMKNSINTFHSLALIAAMGTSSSLLAEDNSEILKLKQELQELKAIVKAMQTTQVNSPSSAYMELKKSIAKDKEEIAELKETTQVLIDETSDLKSGFNYTTVDTSKSHSGLASAASKVYYSKSPLSIGGYGEMYYSRTKDNATANANVNETLDVYRFIPYIGYKFTDNIILNTELEFEHGGADGNNGGKAIIEFMYLDFLLNTNYNFRVGHLLVPMGLINEKHEPTLFTTVQRPETSKYILPSTWHDSGVMMYGEVTEGVEYKLGVFNSLDATQTDAKSWIRDARAGSDKQSGNIDTSMVARLDYTGTNGLLLGASVYKDKNMQIADIHLDAQYSGARVYGTYAMAQRSQGALASSNAKEAQGGFVNLSYDILSSKNSLPLFVQYEHYNTEDQRFDGTSGDTTKITSFGANYFPHEQVVLKLDYAMKRKGSTDTDTASLSMGFIF